MLQKQCIKSLNAHLSVQKVVIALLVVSGLGSVSTSAAPSAAHFRARKYYAVPMAGFYRNRGHGFKNGFEKLINCYMNIIIIIIIIFILGYMLYYTEHTAGVSSPN